MKRLDWNELDAAARAEALARPAHGVARAGKVREIIATVCREGDAALGRYGRQFDGCALEDFGVSIDEFAVAERTVPGRLKQAIASAIERIEAFHRAGMMREVRVETASGVVCERITRPIDRVGLYVPAGGAPLPSTAMMLGVPATLAGCRDVVLCTPPRSDGGADATVLYVANRLGIKRVFKIGGAQAVAAMAFGTPSIPCCDKLFGPGNAWVTEAKRQVAMMTDGPAIDMLAGPSEVLVIADGSADASCVAADLLSQAEHGPDSQVLLVTDAVSLADAVREELEHQLKELPRADIARRALESARLIRVDSLDEAVALSNVYAPEHLIVNVREPRELLADIRNAGSVFLGAFSPESAGDYCSGTNHVLPTGGCARAWSGLSVTDFQKRITVQTLSAEGLRNIGEDIVTL
ncbi:MAG: histidinol dehydrogenase, partial [Sinobacteraceae bacterium]|nr:histidinol dehydrogenase [Nevskiaceae bacterium]